MRHYNSYACEIIYTCKANVSSIKTSDINLVTDESVIKNTCKYNKKDAFNSCEKVINIQTINILAANRFVIDLFPIKSICCTYNS